MKKDFELNDVGQLGILEQRIKNEKEEVARLQKELDSSKTESARALEIQKNKVKQQDDKLKKLCNNLIEDVNTKLLTEKQEEEKNLLIETKQDVSSIRYRIFLLSKMPEIASYDDYKNAYIFVKPINGDIELYYIGKEADLRKKLEIPDQKECNELLAKKTPDSASFRDDLSDQQLEQFLKIMNFNKEVPSTSLPARMEVGAVNVIFSATSEMIKQEGIYEQGKSEWEVRMKEKSSKYQKAIEELNKLGLEKQELEKKQKKDSIPQGAKPFIELIDKENLKTAGKDFDSIIDSKGFDKFFRDIHVVSYLCNIPECREFFLKQKPETYPIAYLYAALSKITMEQNRINEGAPEKTRLSFIQLDELDKNIQLASIQFKDQNSGLKAEAWNVRAKIIKLKLPLLNLQKLEEAKEELLVILKDLGPEHPYYASVNDIFALINQEKISKDSQKLFSLTREEKEPVSRESFESLESAIENLVVTDEKSTSENWRNSLRVDQGGNFTFEKSEGLHKKSTRVTSDDSARALEKAFTVLGNSLDYKTSASMIAKITHDLITSGFGQGVLKHNSQGKKLLTQYEEIAKKLFSDLKSDVTKDFFCKMPDSLQQKWIKTDVNLLPYAAPAVRKALLTDTKGKILTAYTNKNAQVLTNLITDITSNIGEITKKTNEKEIELNKEAIKASQEKIKKAIEQLGQAVIVKENIQNFFSDDIQKEFVKNIMLNKEFKTEYFHKLPEALQREAIKKEPTLFPYASGETREVIFKDKEELQKIWDHSDDLKIFVCSASHLWVEHNTRIFDSETGAFDVGPLTLDGMTKARIEPLLPKRPEDQKALLLKLSGITVDTFTFFDAPALQNKDKDLALKIGLEGFATSAHISVQLLALKENILPLPVLLPSKNEAMVKEYIESLSENQEVQTALIQLSLDMRSLLTLQEQLIKHKQWYKKDGSPMEGAASKLYLMIAPMRLLLDTEIKKLKNSTLEQKENVQKEILGDIKKVYHTVIYKNTYGYEKEDKNVAKTFEKLNKRYSNGNEEHRKFYLKMENKKNKLLDDYEDLSTQNKASQQTNAQNLSNEITKIIGDLQLYQNDKKLPPEWEALFKKLIESVVTVKQNMEEDFGDRLLKEKNVTPKNEPLPKTVIEKQGVVKNEEPKEPILVMKSDSSQDQTEKLKNILKEIEGMSSALEGIEKKIKDIQADEKEGKKIEEAIRQAIHQSREPEKDLLKQQRVINERLTASRAAITEPREKIKIIIEQLGKTSIGPKEIENFFPKGSTERNFIKTVTLNKKLAQEDFHKLPEALQLDLIKEEPTLFPYASLETREAIIEDKQWVKKIWDQGSSDLKIFICYAMIAQDLVDISLLDKSRGAMTRGSLTQRKNVNARIKPLLPTSRKEQEPLLEKLSQVTADTFAFSDAPEVKKVDPDLCRIIGIQSFCCALDKSLQLSALEKGIAPFHVFPLPENEAVVKQYIEGLGGNPEVKQALIDLYLDWRSLQELREQLISLGNWYDKKDMRGTIQKMRDRLTNLLEESIKKLKNATSDQKENAQKEILEDIQGNYHTFIYRNTYGYQNEKDKMVCKTFEELNKRYSTDNEKLREFYLQMENRVNKLEKDSIYSYSAEDISQKEEKEQYRKEQYRIATEINDIRGKLISFQQELPSGWWSELLEKLMKRVEPVRELMEKEGFASLKTNLDIKNDTQLGMSAQDIEKQQKVKLFLELIEKGNSKKIKDKDFDSLIKKQGVEFFNDIHVASQLFSIPALEEYFLKQKPETYPVAYLHAAASKITMEQNKINDGIQEKTSLSVTQLDELDKNIRLASIQFKDQNSSLKAEAWNVRAKIIKLKLPSLNLQQLEEAEEEVSAILKDLGPENFYYSSVSEISSLISKKIMGLSSKGILTASDDFLLPEKNITQKGEVKKPDVEVKEGPQVEVKPIAPQAVIVQNPIQKVAPEYLLRLKPDQKYVGYIYVEDRGFDKSYNFKVKTKINKEDGWNDEIIVDNIIRIRDGGTTTINLKDNKYGFKKIYIPAPDEKEQSYLEMENGEKIILDGVNIKGVKFKDIGGTFEPVVSMLEELPQVQVPLKEEAKTETVLDKEVNRLKKEFSRKNLTGEKTSEEEIKKLSNLVLEQREIAKAQKVKETEERIKQREDKWIAKIGEYDNDPFTTGVDKDGNLIKVQVDTKDTAEKQVREILGNNAEALAALYEGTNKQEVTTAREAFIKYLNGQMEKFKLDPPVLNPDSTINTEAYLGKEGLELYYKAVEEEKKSPSFLNAGLLTAAGFYPGMDPGPTQKIIIVSGSSATGKSFSFKLLLEQMAAAAKGKGAYVVAIDGGDARLFSQMRQLLLQAGLSIPECIGIQDLQDQTDCAIKDRIEAAAKIAGLHMVFPLTFADPKEDKKLDEYLLLEDQGKVKVEFSIVEADKKPTKIGGKLRAFVPKGQKKKYFPPGNEIKMNNRKIRFESKDYESWHFETGHVKSQLAQKRFMERRPNGKVWTINNDFMYVKKQEDGSWVECKSRKELSAGVEFTRVSKRDYEVWKNIDQLIEQLEGRSEKPLPQTYIEKFKTFGKLEELVTFKKGLVEEFKAFKTNKDLEGWNEYCQKRNLAHLPDIKSIPNTLSAKDKMAFNLAIAANLLVVLQDEVRGAPKTVTKALEKTEIKKHKKELGKSSLSLFSSDSMQGNSAEDLVTALRSIMRQESILDTRHGELKKLQYGEDQLSELKKSFELKKTELLDSYPRNVENLEAIFKYFETADKSNTTRKVFSFIVENWINKADKETFSTKIDEITKLLTLPESALGPTVSFQEISKLKNASEMFESLKLAIEALATGDQKLRFDEKKGFSAKGPLAKSDTLPSKTAFSEALKVLQKSLADKQQDPVQTLVLLNTLGASEFGKRVLLNFPDVKKEYQQALENSAEDRITALRSIMRQESELEKDDLKKNQYSEDQLSDLKKRFTAQKEALLNSSGDNLKGLLKHFEAALSSIVKEKSSEKQAELGKIFNYIFNAEKVGKVLAENEELLKRKNNIDIVLTSKEFSLGSKVSFKDISNLTSATGKTEPTEENLEDVKAWLEEDQPGLTKKELPTPILKDVVPQKEDESKLAEFNKAIEKCKATFETAVKTRTEQDINIWKNSMDDVQDVLQRLRNEVFESYPDKKSLMEQYVPTKQQYEAYKNIVQKAIQFGAEKLVEAWKQENDTFEKAFSKIEAVALLFPREKFILLNDSQTAFTEMLEKFHGAQKWQAQSDETYKKTMGEFQTQLGDAQKLFKETGNFTDYHKTSAKLYEEWMGFSGKFPRLPEETQKASDELSAKLAWSQNILFLEPSSREETLVNVLDAMDFYVEYTKGDAKEIDNIKEQFEKWKNDQKTKKILSKGSSKEKLLLRVQKIEKGFATAKSKIADFLRTETDKLEGEANQQTTQTIENHFEKMSKIEDGLKKFTELDIRVYLGTIASRLKTVKEKVAPLMVQKIQADWEKAKTDGQYKMGDVAYKEDATKFLGKLGKYNLSSEVAGTLQEELEVAAGRKMASATLETKYENFLTAIRPGPGQLNLEQRLKEIGPDQETLAGLKTKFKDLPKEKDQIEKLQYKLYTGTYFLLEALKLNDAALTTEKLDTILKDTESALANMKDIKPEDMVKSVYANSLDFPIKGWISPEKIAALMLENPGREDELMKRTNAINKQFGLPEYSVKNYYEIMVSKYQDFNGEFYKGNSAWTLELRLKKLEELKQVRFLLEGWEKKLEALPGTVDEFQYAVQRYIQNLLPINAIVELVDKHNDYIAAWLSEPRFEDGGKLTIQMDAIVSEYRDKKSVSIENALQFLFDARAEAAIKHVAVHKDFILGMLALVGTNEQNILNIDSAIKNWLEDKKITFEKFNGVVELLKEAGALDRMEEVPRLKLKRRDPALQAIYKVALSIEQVFLSKQQQEELGQWLETEPGKAALEKYNALSLKYKDKNAETVNKEPYTFDALLKAQQDVSTDLAVLADLKKQFGEKKIPGEDLGDKLKKIQETIAQALVEHVALSEKAKKLQQDIASLPSSGEGGLKLLNEQISKHQASLHDKDASVAKIEWEANITEINSLLSSWNKITEAWSPAHPDQKLEEDQILKTSDWQKIGDILNKMGDSDSKIVNALKQQYSDSLIAAVGRGLKKNKIDNLETFSDNLRKKVVKIEPFVNQEVFWPSTSEDRNANWWVKNFYINPLLAYQFQLNRTRLQLNELRFRGSVESARQPKALLGTFQNLYNAVPDKTRLPSGISIEKINKNAEMVFENLVDYENKKSVGVVVHSTTFWDTTKRIANMVFFGLPLAPVLIYRAVQYPLEEAQTKWIKDTRATDWLDPTDKDMETFAKVLEQPGQNKLTDEAKNRFQKLSSKDKEPFLSNLNKLDAFLVSKKIVASSTLAPGLFSEESLASKISILNSKDLTLDGKSKLFSTLTEESIRLVLRDIRLTDEVVKDALNKQLQSLATPTPKEKVPVKGWVEQSPTMIDLGPKIPEPEKKSGEHPMMIDFSEPTVLKKETAENPIPIVQKETILPTPPPKQPVKIPELTQQFDLKASHNVVADYFKKEARYEEMAPTPQGAARFKETYGDKQAATITVAPAETGARLTVTAKEGDLMDAVERAVSVVLKNDPQAVFRIPQGTSQAQADNLMRLLKKMNVADAQIKPAAGKFPPATFHAHPPGSGDVESSAPKVTEGNKNVWTEKKGQ